MSNTTHQRVPDDAIESITMGATRRIVGALGDAAHYVRKQHDPERALEDEGYRQEIEDLLHSIALAMRDGFPDVDTADYCEIAAIVDALDLVRQPPTSWTP